MRWTRNPLLWLLIALVAVIAAFRLETRQTPNAIPMLTLAVFAAAYFRGRWALLLPAALLVVTNAALAVLHGSMDYLWYSTLPVVALCYVGLGLLAAKLRPHFSGLKGAALGTGLALLGSVAFFLITNLAVWALEPWYAPTWAGLVECYTMALPFFRGGAEGQAIGTLQMELLAGVATFGLAAAAQAWAPQAQRATA